MRERTEHILIAVLVILLLPCALTYLLGERMDAIYRTIKNETDYITVRTNSGALELELEEYVIGVAAGQIPSGSDLEAVKAQMVVARTNIYRQIQEKGQVEKETYLTMEELERTGTAEKFLRAQRETKGQVLLWEDKPIMASYHAVSAGKTRSAKEVFQSEDYPYLQSKVCPSDENAPGSISEIQIDSSWADMEIHTRDSAGYVLQIDMEGEILSGEEFRNLLGLPSANFEIHTRDDNVFLTTHGIGHGLGMSQYTAQQLALAGKNYRDILSYFYPRTEIHQY